jgi:hypothetical protein
MAVGSNSNNTAAARLLVCLERFSIACFPRNTPGVNFQLANKLKGAESENTSKPRRADGYSNGHGNAQQ